jgi:hypothetical protein
MSRASRSKTMSVSLAPEPLDVLRRRAKEVHDGNLSAAIAEAAELLRRDMAMGELVSDLERAHGPVTDHDRIGFEAELRATAPRRRRRKRAAT